MTYQAAGIPATRIGHISSGIRISDAAAIQFACQATNAIASSIAGIDCTGCIGIGNGAVSEISDETTHRIVSVCQRSSRNCARCIGIGHCGIFASSTDQTTNATVSSDCTRSVDILNRHVFSIANQTTHITFIGGIHSIDDGCRIGIEN